MPKKLGITRKEAQEAFDRLSKDMEEVEKELEKLKIDPQSTDLGDKIRRLRASLSTTVEGYTLYVLESMEDETRKIKWLTAVLIGLTGVLAVLTALLASGIKP
jgi:hypothetical protein